MNKVEIFVDRFLTGAFVVLAVFWLGLGPFIFPDAGIMVWALAVSGVATVYFIGFGIEKVLQNGEKSGGSR